MSDALDDVLLKWATELVCPNSHEATTEYEMRAVNSYVIAGAKLLSLLNTDLAALRRDIQGYRKTCYEDTLKIHTQENEIFALRAELEETKDRERVISIDKNMALAEIIKLRAENQRLKEAVEEAKADAEKLALVLQAYVNSHGNKSDALISHDNLVQSEKANDLHPEQA